MNNFYRKYLMPGLIFQSIIIGGGYGTGREMVEFFMNKGPISGYLGMLVAMVIWSIVMAVGFELARKERLFDYRSLLKALLGRAWIIFEIVFVATMILVIAVMGSASGALLNTMLGWPPFVGIMLMFLVVGLLIFKGSKLIEKAFSIWSVVLYIAYILLVIYAFYQFDDQIWTQLKVGPENASWLLGGLQYAAYNLGILPAILFVARHFEKRKEAVIAGLLSGPLAMIPAILIYTAMLSAYPQIIEETIPVNFLIAQFNAPAFLLFFQLVLFGTFIETGTGLIHGFNERIASEYLERTKQVMRPLMRLLVGLAILVAAVFIANAFGLIAIIAKGYGYITWAFWIIFLLPLLTLGTRKVLKSN